MLYIDTSVLLVYTLTQAVETDRFPATDAFFAQIAAGTLVGATSFYALQEVHVFAIDNAPDFLTGAAFGKAALEKILALPLVIIPFVSRIERKEGKGVGGKRGQVLQSSNGIGRVRPDDAPFTCGVPRGCLSCDLPRRWPRRHLRGRE